MNTTLCWPVMVAMALSGCAGGVGGGDGGAVRSDGCKEVSVVAARTSIRRGQNLEVIMVDGVGGICVYSFPAHSFTANESRIMRAIQVSRRSGVVDALGAREGWERLHPAYSWGPVVPAVRLLVPEGTLEGMWRWEEIERWVLEGEGT